MDPTVEAEQATRRAQVVEALRPGQTALDAGCGTGRALPHLWAAVAPGGQVLGFDLTPEMLATARDHGRHAHALVAASSCSTPTGGSPWPHATAGACARTTSLPPTPSACCWIALALRSANPETSRLICRILSQELISIV
jgi:SAM-dependent methyltransferase